jgi:peptidoglycan/LPS O-acetylase OafA/YrhL
MLYLLRIADRVYRKVVPPAAIVELPRGHVPALDAIRGLAIFLVTLYRFGGGTEGPGQTMVVRGLSYLGTVGVDLFFVLSGFLITGILFDAKGQTHYFRNFYIRRSLRIFPLYYVALFLALLVLPRVAPSLADDFQPAIDNQSWLWFYGANVIQSARGSWCLGPFNPFWSLSVEEHFYLLWPAVIFFASRTTGIRLCVFLIGTSALARMGWLAAGGNDVAAYTLTPLRMDGLALGSWVALVARGPQGFDWLSFWARPVLLATGSFVVAMLAISPRFLDLHFLTWGVTFAALLVLTLASPPNSWPGLLGSSRLLQFLGKYSYAMYIFQLPLVILLAPLVTAPGLAATLGSACLGQLVYCGLMFGITVSLAVVSWHCFEKHVLALKHRFQ